MSVTLHEPSANGTGVMEINLYPVKFNLPGGKSFELEIYDTQMELGEIWDKAVKENEPVIEANKAAGKPEKDWDNLPVTAYGLLDRYREYFHCKGIELSRGQTDAVVQEVRKIHALTKKKQQDFWAEYAKSQNSTESTPAEAA